ncbi:MAG: hypothetical protein ACPGUD_13960 [Parashewanella sp.]
MTAPTPPAGMPTLDPYDPNERHDDRESSGEAPRARTLSSASTVSSASTASSGSRRSSVSNFSADDVPLERPIDHQRDIGERDAEIRDRAEQNEKMQKMIKDMQARGMAKSEFLHSLGPLLFSAGLFSGSLVLTAVTAGAAAPLALYFGAGLVVSGADAATSLYNWRSRASGGKGLPLYGDSVGNVLHAILKKVGMKNDEKRQKVSDWVSFSIRCVVAPVTNFNLAYRPQPNDEPGKDMDPVMKESIKNRSTGTPSFTTKNTFDPGFGPIETPEARTQRLRAESAQHAQEEEAARIKAQEKQRRKDMAEGRVRMSDLLANLDDSYESLTGH